MRMLHTIFIISLFLLVPSQTADGLTQEQISPSLPTALAKRGELIVDDDGSMERGGKTLRSFENGVSLKSALGIWERSKSDANVWRSAWTEGMGHPPVVSYPGVIADNLIVEVTFRYGENTEPWHSQFLRIAADQRPQINGHIVSAWINPNGRYTEKNSIVLEHVPPRGRQGILMDHQPLTAEPSTWYTATLEIVDDEALFRMNDQVAYTKTEEIAIAKNLVSLTLGTTWHEIKRVRIWHAEANPDWEAIKDTVLKSRAPFVARTR